MDTLSLEKTLHKPKPSYISKNDVEEITENLVKELGLEIGSGLEALVRDMGGRVSYRSSEADEIDGGSIVAEGLDDFDIYLSQYTSPARDRFTIAHELGHLFLHLPMVKKIDPHGTMRATRWIDNSDKEQQRAEWEANWFAAALLMPRKAFTASLKQGGIDYAAMKFNVSRQAATVRKTSLQL